MGTVAAVAVVLWRTVSTGAVGAADHFTYDRTVRYLQGGEGYYDAMRRAFADLDTTIGHARAFRGPLIFLFWQLLPRPWLYGAFLLLVVVSSTYLLARASRFPWAALPVGLYLVVAGRVPWGAATDLRETWMLVEYWTVPILAGALVCWRRPEWWWAAALVGLYRDDRIELVFVGPLLALPLTGLVVDRPYWGIVVVPFTLFYVGELVGREVVHRRQTGPPPEPIGHTDRADRAVSPST